MPKKTFCHKMIIDMGVNAAIIHYNDGLSAVSRLFEKFGFDGRHVTSKLSQRADLKSIRKSIIKTCEKEKKRRKQLRSKDKTQKDKETESEPQESYEKGGY